MKSNLRFFPLCAAIVAAVFSMSSHAGNNSNQGGGNTTTTNQGGDGGTGIGVGVGTATAGAAAAASSNATAVQGQIQGQAQHQSATANSGGNSQSVTVQGDAAQERNPVSAAIAPAMNSTTNCAIGVSAGITVASASISGGSAYESVHCQTIEEAKANYIMGNKATADELLCDLPKTRAARLREGRPCSADKATPAKTAAASDANKPWLTDPLARKRDGLPPL